MHVYNRNHSIYILSNNENVSYVGNAIYYKKQNKNNRVKKQRLSVLCLVYHYVMLELSLGQLIVLLPRHLGAPGRTVPIPSSGLRLEQNKQTKGRVMFPNRS